MTALTVVNPARDEERSATALTVRESGGLQADTAIRTVQLVLGALWLLDGVLQLQPSMFSSAFVASVLAPAAHGQPSWLGWLLGVNTHLISAHVAAWNALFAAVQILIGVGLMVPGTVRPALILGAAWSGGVWVLGEGLGMLPTGSASPLTGAPGAVMLYGLVGLMAWPLPGVRRDSRRASAASASLVGDRGGRAVWAVVWGASAVLWLLPANTAHGAIGQQIAGMASGEPGWLAHLDQIAGRAAASSGVVQAAALALISAVIGLGPLIGRRPHVYLAAGAVLSLCYWIFGQNFGGVLTAPGGTATDPNTGPLLVLMAAALVPWPVLRSTDQRLRGVAPGSRRFRSRAAADGPTRL